MMPAAPSLAVLNARYVAIRTAEARGLTEELYRATRERTPGVRRMLIPMLYRFWRREREKGWEMLQRIGADIVRFPGIPEQFATETFAELSLAILNGCRHEPAELQRLAAIWRLQMERVFATPLARLLGSGMTLRLLARPVAAVLQRQPAYQPLNFRELAVTFARPDEDRRTWREALACLDEPARGIDPIADILGDRDRPFDLYMMLLAERTLIHHGLAGERSELLASLEALFDDGAPWFRQSILYILFHVLGRARDVTDDELHRYSAIAEKFFRSGSWRMKTSVAEYDFAVHMGWPEIVLDRQRPGAAPKILPGLMERAVAAGDEAEIAGLFGATDTIAFAHGHAPLALNVLERFAAAGGERVEERVLKSLATIRLQDQPLVDAFLEEHRNLSRLKERLEGVEPTIRAEDMPTLLDGLTVDLIVTSDYFRGRVADAFRRAAEARSAPEFLVQILAWLREEFRAMEPRGR